MQIHELTKTRLNEGLGTGLGGAAGQTVSGIKNVGSAIASPFKNIGQGYQQGRADQTISMLADKLERSWQNYSVQWAKSQGGQYTMPGKGAAPATSATDTAAGTAGASAGQQKKQSTRQPSVKAQDLFSTVQALSNPQLNAVAKILSQKVGPAATMNALKTPEPGAPVSESQLNEFGWNDIKSGAQKFGAGVKSAYQATAPVVKKAARTGVKAIKAAPGAVADVAGGTVGAVAGMPARAGTAYRGAKASVSGPKMTIPELQMALTKLSGPEAQKLFSFVQQIQSARKSGLKEGLSPATLLPGYESALKAFVQKNLLAGMQYSRLQNVQQFDELVKKIVDPANDSASAQKDLWNKLTLAASVAQHNPASGGKQQTSPGNAGATDDADAGGKAPSGSDETAEDLQPTIAQALKGLGQDKNAATVGQLIRKNFADNATSIRSTGVPAVDAMLLNMGFKPA